MEVFHLVFLVVFCTVPTSSLLNQAVSTGHNDEMIKELMANFSQLRNDMEVFKGREQELNKTIQIQQQIIHDQNMTIKELEYRVNQSFAAHEVILNDVVDKLSHQEHMNGGSKTNISGQIRYLALSLLDVRKQFEIFNTSEQGVAKRTENHLKDLNNQMARLNNSLQGEMKNVAFTVGRTSHGAPGTQKLIYDKVITNVGNAYSTQTGVFTCPCDGIYVFTWSTMSYNAGSQDCVAPIYRNGDRLLEAFSHEAGGGQNEEASNTIILSLIVGDRVWIQTERCGWFWGYPYTAFSGWKL